MLKPFSTIFIFLAALLVSYQLGGQGLKQWFDCYYSRPSAVARQYVNGTNSVLKSSTPVIAHPGWDTGFELRSTVESNMAYYEYTGALEKSPTDPREFRLIRLKNNMTVVCIHDPDSVDSAASLSVNIGHEYNPPEFLGLAHFLEHMLFQGSQKYPGENSYNEYISRFSGSDNAFTSDVETCYHFSLANNGLEGALDRFSRFFIDPLLNASSVDKELLAVDSEYKGNLMNDGWRAYQLLKQVSNPDHPFSQFPIGSTETLRDSAKALGVDLHSELLKLHSKYYSADIMKLVVAGNHTLDQLTEWAVSKFSEVKSKGNPKTVWQSLPLTKNELGQLVHVESLGDGQGMSLVFALPEIKNAYRSGALAYISYLFSSQGEGSIYHYLQKQGWILGLDTSENSMITDNYNMFYIEVELTPKGMDHRDDIVHAIFAYLRMLSEQGPQEWYYEELRKINHLDTYFYEKSPVERYVTARAGILHNEYIRPEHVMTAQKRFGDFDPVMISDLLSYLHPDNYMLMVFAKEHKDVECSLTEKYFGTKYHVARLPASLTTNPDAGFKYRNLFAMPKPNAYLPSNLKMDADVPAKKTSDVSVAPVYLKGNERMEVWYKKDNQFFTPRGAIYVDIQVASINTPFYEAVNSIYAMYLAEVLFNDLQPAMLAGLHYHVTPYIGGISIQITGFSEKQKLLLSAIIEKIKGLVIDEQLFKTQLDMVIDRYQNYRNFKPLEHASLFLTHIHGEPSWHYTQVLPELNKVGLSDLQSFADHVADQAFFTTLVAGDFEESDALDIASKVDTLLNSTALPEYLQSNGRVISLDPGYFVYQAAAPEKKTKNSAFRGEIYCGDTGDRQEAMALMLLKSIIYEPFFDQLRTKEQLGYQVGVSHKKYGSSQYITLIVQGESSPAYMTMRAESFIRSFRKQLVDYDEESLATKISSLVELILEKPKTIFKEASELWSEIDSGNYDFGAKAKSAQVLKSLTKSHLIEFWDKYINPDTAPSYKRIDSQIWSSFTLQPTEVQFGNYSLSAVALQGCLHQEGVANISLSAANDIIASSSSSDHGVPFALKMIQDIIAKDYHDSEELLVKIMEPTSKTRIALQMAMDQAAEKRSFAAAGSQNFTKIGMHQSPDGIWLINDIRRFKASQQLKARRLPFNQPQPIY